MRLLLLLILAALFIASYESSVTEETLAQGQRSKREAATG
jgi:hypothetical protein